MSPLPVFPDKAAKGALPLPGSDPCRTLPQSEENFRNVLDHLPDLVLVHRDGIIIYVNPAMFDTLGLQPEDVLHKPILAFVPPEYHADVAAAIRKRTETGRDHPYEIEILPRKGEPRAVLIRGSSIEFDGVPATLNVLTDITERRRMEVALKGSEEKFRGIFDMINDAIHIHEIEVDGRPGKFIEVNDVACRMLQYTREELLEHSPLDFVTEYHSRPPEEIFAELISTGHAIFETEHRRKDGTVITVEVNTNVVTLMGKRVAVSAVRDITGRKRAEEELQKSEEKFRAFFTTSRDCVFITTLDGSWVDFNDAAVELFGYESRKDLLKIKVSDIYANPAEREAHIRHIRARGYSFEYPVDLKKKDGTIINALITTTPRKDASGNVIGFQGSIRDVTQQKQTEGLLLENQMQLATAMDLAHLANWELDVPSGVFTFNNRFYAMYGTTAEREGGYTMPAEVYTREFVHPEMHSL